MIIQIQKYQTKYDINACFIIIFLNTSWKYNSGRKSLTSVLADGITFFHLFSW